MRIFIFIILLIMAPAIAGIYGFIHDQITFSISEEFFTKVRFNEFDLPKNWSPAIKAGIIGIFTAAKAGIPLGIVLTAVGKIHRKDSDLLSYTVYAYMITMFTAFACTLIAIYLPQTPERLMEAVTLPMNINDPISFQRVVTINNFGYAGGVIGMLMGISLQIFFYKKNLKKENPGTPKA